MYSMDRLYEAVAAKGHVCVGLDTSPECLPPAHGQDSPAEAALAYNKALVDAAREYAACFKVQIACYEALGLAGLAAYAKTLAYIRAQNIPVIADIKRGDIADTAARYAQAHFQGEFEADFVTLSPYMGMDSIEPWFSWAERAGKGAFVLMRTSNKGMRDFEYLEIQEGGSPPLTPYPEAASRLRGYSVTPPPGGAAPKPPPKRLYDAVGEKLAALAVRCRGRSGYGAFGAVTGCTEREEAAAIRRRYAGLFFLIPGYGAQGGAADDAALLLNQGNGGVVNASRSIITAWAKTPGAEKADIAFAAEAAACAAKEMRDAIRKAAG